MINRILWLLPALLIFSCARPVAKFSMEPEHGKALVPMNFTNHSAKAESYEWNFGDGVTSSEPSPEHVYKASGNYVVQLKAIKGNKVDIMEKNIQVKAPEKCLVEIETDFGNMVVQLYDATPQHRDNFLKLAEDGYFDGLLFHRVIEGFMIQGGDPQSKNAAPRAQLGMGGPGYTVPAEFVDSLIHVKGALAAARTGDGVNPKKESSGSQFYIVQGQVQTEDQLSMMEARKDMRYTSEQRDLYTQLGGTPFLDRDYTVFGRVVEGLEVIDKIAAVETDGANRPLKDVKMKVKVIR